VGWKTATVRASRGAGNSQSPVVTIVTGGPVIGRRDNRRMTATPRILVTGGSGYIAGVLIRQLLSAGWQVHTTLRDPAREPALRRLLGVSPGDAPLRCFRADLLQDAGWAEAAAGCSHLAQPE